MNKLKLFLGIAVFCILVIPFAVFAEEETTTTNSDSNEVIVYFFRGEGCSHCAEFEAWLEEIEAEHGSKFQVKDYETWYNEDNANLMQQVAAARDEEAEGVPYIIIGKHSWNGFDDSYKTEILEVIDEMYNTDPSERYDIMQHLSTTQAKKTDNDNTASSIIAIIITLLVVGGIVFGIIQSRKTIDNTTEDKKENKTNKTKANFCTECGNKLKDEKFCPECGNKIK